jgi:hypothetical protein
LFQLLVASPPKKRVMLDFTTKIKVMEGSEEDKLTVHPGKVLILKSLELQLAGVGLIRYST